MAEFPNKVFTQSVGRSHRDKGISHKKKIHKPRHTSSRSWDVSTSSFSSTMSCPSSFTSDDSEQNIRSKLKKIKKEGKRLRAKRPRKGKNTVCAYVSLKCFKIAHNRISLIWGDIKNERLCNGNASSSFWDVIRAS